MRTATGVCRPLCVIGKWNNLRLTTYPKKGNGRITFLVTDGLYFGQASTNALFKDPMAVSVLITGDVVVQYLTRKVEQETQPRATRICLYYISLSRIKAILIRENSISKIHNY
jgi:hypothetical protein